MDKVKICRACLAENVPMLSLYEPYEHELSLAVILQTCLATEVFVGDNLPRYLCDKCIQIITQFYNFTIIYEQSDQHLRSVVVKSVKREPDVNLEEQDAANHSLLEDSGNLEFVHPQYSVNAANADDNHADIISNLANYNYDDVKEGTTYSVDGVAQGDAEYITLDTIKTENLDLEICNSFSPQVVVGSQLDKIVSKNESGSYEDVTKYECSICGEQHLYLTAFRNHMRIRHSIFHVNPSEFSSTIQIKVPESEPLINMLTQAHDDILCGEPQIKCDICPKKFHFQAQLNKHTKVHEMSKKFVCEVCGASFIRKTYLEDHKEGHSTERKHTCPYCNKKFRRRTVLRAHKRSHTHRNHYVCELCGRAFTGKGTLRTHHLLIHVRERNFECMICHLKFPLKSTLNKHVIRHEKRERGEKGFNCPECEMEYRDKSSLKRHVEVKHLGNVILVPCPDCPKEYTSNANLQKHRKRHHPNEIDML